MHVVLVDHSFHSRNVGNAHLTRREELLARLKSKHEADGEHIHHGIQEHRVPQSENHSGLVPHTLDLVTDRSGDLMLGAKTDQMRI